MKRPRGHFAHLKASSPWYSLFERGMAPIKNIVLPRTGNMEGGGGVQEFYDLDLDACSDEQREKIFAMVAKQCGGTVEQAKDGIAGQGTLPLRAIHVSSVSTDSMAFL
jgi:hypothetical protein